MWWTNGLHEFRKNIRWKLRKAIRQNVPTIGNHTTKPNIGTGPNLIVESFCESMNKVPKLTSQKNLDKRQKSHGGTTTASNKRSNQAQKALSLLLENYFTQVKINAVLEIAPKMIKTGVKSVDWIRNCPEKWKQTEQKVYGISQLYLNGPAESKMFTLIPVTWQNKFILTIRKFF